MENTQRVFSTYILIEVKKAVMHKKKENEIGACTCMNEPKVTRNMKWSEAADVTSAHVTLFLHAAMRKSFPRSQQ